MSNLLYVSADLMANIILFLLCGLFLHPRVDRKKYRMIIIAAAFLMTMIAHMLEEGVLFFSGLLIGILLKEAAFFIITLLFCLSCFDSKILARIGTAVLVISLQTISKLMWYSTILYLSQLNVSHIFINSIEYRMIFSLVTEFSYSLLLYIISKIKSGSNFLVLFFPLAVYAAFFIPFGTATQEHIPYWNLRYCSVIILLIIMIAAAILVLSDKISKNNELKTQNRIIQSEQEMYRKQVAESNKYIEEIASIKHNMKNKIWCISELIKNGNTEEALELCDDINNELNRSAYRFYTDNIYLNSILNVICKKAKEKHIDIKTVIKTDLKQINGTDLISLLGNLCDNAIEALENINDKICMISLFEKGGCYIISVKNRIAGSVLSDNHELKTSKEDALYHGYGLKTVRSIVRKYDGILDISEEDHLFVVNIMMGIPSTTK